MMAENIEAALGEYNRLLRRHGELKSNLAKIGEQLQEIGQALKDTPEWVKFDGGVPARPFDQATQLDPTPLKSLENIQSMVKELRDGYYHIEMTLKKLEAYEFGVKEPPQPPENPFLGPVRFV
jgi:hypothetical protein